MNVTQFIQEIAQYPELPLRFQYGEHDQVVAGGYHVTEIKRVRHETIDCGNSLHMWNDVTVQVWVPEEVEPDAPRMSAGKFSKIWNAVHKRIPLDQDDNAEIRVEYGDGNRLTASYHVDQVRAAEDSVTIVMTPPRTMCKPRELLSELNEVNGVASSACCAPSTPSNQNGVASTCCAPSIPSNQIRIETILPLP